MRHTRGLESSPPARYKLEVERSSGFTRAEELLTREAVAHRLPTFSPVRAGCRETEAHCGA